MPRTDVSQETSRTDGEQANACARGCNACVARVTREGHPGSTVSGRMPAQEEKAQMSDNSKLATADTRGAKVVVERTYRAGAQELWDLWTTKEGFESWWGPEGFRVEVYKLEARV